MSDAGNADDGGDLDDIEAIRERKKAELAASADEDGTVETDADEADAASTAEPAHVDSPAHLDELVADHDVVLADFYADWCGPCQMLEPVVERVAADTDALVAKVDVDEHQGLAREYGVQGVPTLFLFVDGEPAERLVGMQDEGTLLDLVERHG